MSVRVNLPPGCSGFRAQDGTLYSARKGTSVVVEDAHEGFLRNGMHVRAGVISVAGATSLGTKRGRLCAACKRIWQCWSVTCPKCGAETTET